MVLCTHTRTQCWWIWSTFIRNHMKNLLDSYVLWGQGEMGRKLYRVLRFEGMCSCYIDSRQAIQICWWQLLCVHLLPTSWSVLCQPILWHDKYQKSAYHAVSTSPAVPMLSLVKFSISCDFEIQSGQIQHYHEVFGKIVLIRSPKQCPSCIQPGENQIVVEMLSWTVICFQQSPSTHTKNWAVFWRISSLITHSSTLSWLFSVIRPEKQSTARFSHCKHQWVPSSS